MEKACNEKELLIFQGVLSLMESGVKLYEMKAEDIARKAGIAKGSLYNYFTSKNEMITRAVLYGMEKRLEESIALLKEHDGFAHKMECLFSLLEQVVKEKNTELYTLLFKIDNEDPNELVKENKAFFERVFLKMESMTEELYRYGVKDGELNEGEDSGYVRSVFFSALMGYMNLCGECGGVCTKESGKLYAYQMVVRALR